MSLRRQNAPASTSADMLRAELHALKATQAAVDTAAQAVEDNNSTTQVLSFEELNSTEQSAASLGVHPDAWKPIQCAEPPA